MRCGRGDRRRRVTRPDQDGPVLIGREPLALDKLVFERFQVLGIQLKLQLEGPIRQPAALVQQRDRLIDHRDKVHCVSSLLSTLPAFPVRLHDSIGDKRNVAESQGVRRRV